MSERLGQSARADAAGDLESALQLAHDHARIYGLWEVAEDLGEIIRAMQSRDQQGPPQPMIRTRLTPRRRS
jgi:hypothetical protein